LHGNRSPSDLDSTPTATTTRCNMHQVRVAGSRHRLDRRRQKNGVSDRKQGRRRPEANVTAPYSNGPWTRRKPRQRRGHSRTAIRQVRPSDNSVRQLPWLLSFTTIELVSQLDYYRSPFSAVHNSVTIIHRLTKTILRRTFTSPLTHVHLYSTTHSSHLMQVSH